MARKITYNIFEISLVVFTRNITTNDAITYTNTHVQIDQSIDRSLRPTDVCHELFLRLQGFVCVRDAGRRDNKITVIVLKMTMIVTMKTIKVNDNNGDNHNDNINNMIIRVIKIIKDNYKKGRMALKHQA